MIGGIEDDLGRSIVLLQLDDLGVRVVLFKRQDVAHVRTAEHVDALIVIADDAQVAVLAGEVPHHQVLGPVRVLVLVDHDVLESLLIFLEHVRVAIEQPDRPHQEIVEVERMVLLEKRVVAQADPSRQLLVVRAGGPHLVLGADDLVLGPRDERDHAAGRITLLIEPHLVHDALDDRQPVRLVIDDEVAIDPVGAAIATQDADRDGVEGPHPDGARRQIQEVLDPAAHLAGGFIGKRHCQDFPRLGAALLDEPGDPVGQDPCLAAARAGEDQQRPIIGRHRGALRRIQSG